MAHTRTRDAQVRTEHNALIQKAGLRSLPCFTGSISDIQIEIYVPWHRIVSNPILTKSPKCWPSIARERHGSHSLPVVELPRPGLTIVELPSPYFC
jgi:hypothetical protein